MEDRICDLEADLRAMSRLKPVAAVNYIRKVIGYDDYLRSYAEFRRMKPEELLEIRTSLRKVRRNLRPLRRGRNMRQSTRKN